MIGGKKKAQMGRYKQRMKLTGFAEASTNMIFTGGGENGRYKDSGVYYYHLEGFRPHTDVCHVTTKMKGKKPTRKVSPF